METEEAWRRARALAALGSSDRVERWLRGGIPCPAPPEGWEEALRRRRLWPWVPPAGAGPVLLVRGAASVDGVAVVGARAADAYGLAVARRVAEDAVELGAAVVSGGAEGCDAAAHEGALAAGGRTVVVLGGGHDHVYPRGHGELFARVEAAAGGVVSAYWPGVPVARHRFVARNGVIAGLARVVVVVRAAVRSGSLGTADAAVALGRVVMAVPGDVGEALSGGPHLLLERGAVPLVSSSGLARALRLEGLAGCWPVRHLGSGAPWEPGSGSRSGGGGSSGPQEGVDEVGRTVLDALKGESGLDLDAMVMRTEVAVDAVARALLDLELAGLVARLPGDRYVRVRSHGG